MLFIHRFFLCLAVLKIKSLSFFFFFFSFSFCLCVSQLTEDGLIGLNGRLVVNPAEPVLENVPEAVRDQHRVLAGNLAQEKHGKLTSVTPIHVQVRKWTFNFFLLLKEGWLFSYLLLLLLIPTIRRPHGRTS